MRGMAYFDYSSTTPIAREVASAIESCLSDFWANPSNIYSIARQTKSLIEESRRRVAKLLNAEPGEIIFTSGGTESINSAIHSAVQTTRKSEIVISAVEHHATIRFCKKLHGCKVITIPVNNHGLINLNDIENVITNNTAIVSIMMANNETGIIYPIKEISKICHKKGVLFHTDAVAAAGVIPINVKELNIDFLSISAHKLYGPKGVGALWVRNGVEYCPYIVGGNQEGGRRGGTENITGIVGFGAAAELISQKLNEADSIKILRDYLENNVLKLIPGSHLNTFAEPRMVNISNISFELIKSIDLLFELDKYGICASNGAACKSGNLEPSHVLTAMGYSKRRALSAIRFSLGYYTRQDEVDYLLDVLKTIIQKLRKNSSTSI
ncbi:MAG: aminotransferase class V-fold PLP-dependent enzyme [Verrucomicrobiae bacterium]|nr:aminotransferase class V-fold PLP-dependent enzyme [Verrucomicrobiae bacterium]